MPERAAWTESGTVSDAVVTPPRERADTASTAIQHERPGSASAGGADGADAASADADDDPPAKPHGAGPTAEPAAGVERGWQQVSSALQQVSDGLWDTDISSSEEDEDDLSDADFADGLSDDEVDAQSEEDWDVAGAVAELPQLSDSDLEEEEGDDRDRYYFITSRPAPGGDIYHASRVGDVERVTYLLSADLADINKRDRWDSVPLYYACLAGHAEVAAALLDAGAVCNEYTFDGDRCHYAALNMGIRSLLRKYEARPPPLAPLATDLRNLSPLCEDREAVQQPGQGRPETWCDITLWVGEEQLPAHRALLACRSRTFRRLLTSKWLPHGDGAREVHLRHGQLPAAGLRALLVWMYTERVDVAAADAPDLQLVAARAQCRALTTAIDNELRTVKYYFKSTRQAAKANDAPRRFVLQPGALPEDVRLAADAGRLRGWAAAAEGRGHGRLAGVARGEAAELEDFADVCLAVEGRLFRGHRFVLASRSDYFKALLDHAAAEAADRDDTQSSAVSPAHDANAEGTLPVVEIHDISAGVMERVLDFAYTDSFPRGLGAEWMTPAGAEALFNAADMLLLFSMKRAVAQAVVQDIEERARRAKPPGLEQLCRYLLVADTYSVLPLREPCLVAVANRFEAIAAGRVSERDSAVFREFLRAVAPTEWQDSEQLLDGSHVVGASRGNIEGSGVGGVGIGTLLQDLRETYLETYGGSGKKRDRYADRFDAQLVAFLRRACD